MVKIPLKGSVYSNYNHWPLTVNQSVCSYVSLSWPCSVSIVAVLNATKIHKICYFKVPSCHTSANVLLLLFDEGKSWSDNTSLTKTQRRQNLLKEYAHTHTRTHCTSSQHSAWNINVVCSVLDALGKTSPFFIHSTILYYLITSGKILQSWLSSKLSGNRESWAAFSVVS